MQYLLTEQQKARHGDFKTFVRENVEPFAEKWDREQRIPESVIGMLAKLGYLGCSLPTQHGGHGWDTVTFGLLNEALGRGSSSLNGVLTVQTMVSKALLKWGSVEQIQKWIPMLARGEIIGAFALTESGAGSDIHSLVTEFTHSRGDVLVLNGAKKWITCASSPRYFWCLENWETARWRVWCRGKLPVSRWNPFMIWWGSVPPVWRSLLSTMSKFHQQT